jgi:hypothetical protein
VQRGAAIAMVDLWVRERVRSTEGGDLATEIELANLLAVALTILTVVGDTSAVQHCGHILRLDPQTTPQVMNYLAALAEFDPDSVRSAIRSLVDDVPLTRWQRLWMLALCASPNVPSALSDMPMSWIRSNLLDSSETVRSCAAWALSLSWGLTSDEWAGLTARATQLGNLWLSASLYNASGWNESEKRTALSANRLDRGIYEWVGQWDPFPAPF